MESNADSPRKAPVLRRTSKSRKFAFGWAIDLQRGDLPAFQKFVLVLIADNFNSEAHCAWPSQSTLARKGNMSRSSVNRAIAYLRELGLVQTIQTRDVNTNESLGLYYFLPEFDPFSFAFADPERPVWVEREYGLGSQTHYFYAASGELLHEFTIAINQ